MTDPFKPQSVLTLRHRKRREEKPFALMVRGLEQSHQWCELSISEALLLNSKEKPIVLLKIKKELERVESLAPGLNRLGLMLPYTPLQHLLFELGNFSTLVCTSANLSENPMLYTNAECLHALGTVADYFLVHNRDICSRADDSIVQCHADQPLVLRSARGYAPYSIALPGKRLSILAVGAELKNAICLWEKGYAVSSPYIGDLKNESVYQLFLQQISQFLDFYKLHPDLVVHDSHPAYLSSQWAANSAFPHFSVQHHKAHIYSTLADCHFNGPILGVAMDGVGYGEDETLWGGEFFVGENNELKRVACLERQKLVGGDISVREIWRLMVSLCLQAFGPDDVWKNLDAVKAIPAKEVKLIEQMWNKNINSPLTSSAGRLFDGVAAILNLKATVSYEAQAAMLLESCCGPSAFTYPWHIERQGDLHILMTTPMIRQIVHEQLKGVPVSQISGKFHQTLVQMLTEVIDLISNQTGIKTVALGGGCFQNQFLFQQLLHQLSNKNYQVLFPKKTPLNDMGIALGQVYYAL
ncbi:carbamoyltransferase HypF, partial [Deltaproteobacteria bacterium TL4]